MIYASTENGPMTFRIVPNAISYNDLKGETSRPYILSGQYSSADVPMIRPRRRPLYNMRLLNNLICLEDLGLTAHLSITNDAENLVPELMAIASPFFHNRPIVYRDTLETYDVLLVKDGKFVDFEIHGESADYGLVAKLFNRFPPYFGE